MRKVNTRNVSMLDRNIQIVLTYFGFGSQVFPTLDSVAEEFGLSSRERVRQIVSDKFVNKINREEFLVRFNISQVMEGEEIHFTDELIGKLMDQKVIEEKVNIRGLINLLHAFQLCEEYELYNTSINKATKTEIESMEQLLLLKKEYERPLKAKVKTLKTLPGQHGLVNLHDVMVVNKKFSVEDFPFYQKLLRSTKKVWWSENAENNFGYMVHERDNVIINTLEKIVNITTQVDLHILGEIITVYISKRSFQKKIPSVSLLKEYLSSSPYIELNGRYASLKVEKSSLLEIEKDILYYYERENKSIVNYAEINAYLEEKGYTSSYRKKTLYHCPFIYVDKTKGRGNYQFILITNFSNKAVELKTASPYERMKSRLKQLEGQTDVTQSVKGRKEQDLLREWLFKNKETEECAICGKTFACRSLVAAHKKKRANCTEEERTDPNIVMPVCLFGCDYLYEEGNIRIIAGTINVLPTSTLQSTEEEYLQRLHNRKMDQRWLQGSDHYFQTANLSLEAYS
ncbi:hypothetical protein J2S74_000718 [Evansella vedderi]|uniref:C2H2-type domain-containing protein n=2 Tax=Evansella vedderi TaxID=38282 RepID=A0ABT9ZRI6_9BACI|nr:hypothetical protein [Evansella vedderi]